MMERRLIGLAGYARAGKDTVADYLSCSFGFRKHAFADSMREALYTLNPNIDFEGHRVYLRSIIDSHGWESLKSASLEYRPLMQRLGTEVGRQMFGENVWVDRVMQNLSGLDVISDVRFPNEAEAIKAAGGEVWCIIRPEVGAHNDHSSETSLDGYDFDVELINDSTPSNLFQQVNIRLLKEKAWAR